MAATGEMLDNLGMAETTPGPLIIVTQFVGFMAAYRSPGTLDPMLAATLGAIRTTWVTFVPCFLWVFLRAPLIETLRTNVTLTGAMSAITTAVVGVIMNLAIWFALHVLFREVAIWDGFGMRVDVGVIAVHLVYQCAIFVIEGNGRSTFRSRSAARRSRT